MHSNSGKMIKNAERFSYSKEFPTKEHESGQKHSTNSDSDKESSFSVVKIETIRAFPIGKDPMELHMLSNLDQTMPNTIEIVMAFKKTKQNDVGKILKESLGKALEEYYPLNGRVIVGYDGKMVVDCDGEERGVPFVEAISEQEMVAALGDIAMNDLEKVARKLVYCSPKPYETILDVPPLAIQVTRFRCGGMILGVRFNHVILDGRGFAIFMISWSEIARGFPLSIKPHMDRSFLSPRIPPKLHFPHPEYSKLERPLIPTLIPNHIVVTKSFCISPSMIFKLRKLAMQNNNNNNNKNELDSQAPTTFELISALTWICWTKAMKVGPKETCQICTAVDGRYKLQPPMPEGYVGNGIVWSCAQSRARDLTAQSFSYVVGIVHGAIKAVTEDYVRSTIDFHEVTRKPLEPDNTMFITKWSRLPFYEIDFGWGVPSQVAPGATFDNLVVVLSHEKDSEDRVISLNLPLDAMEIFQEVIQSRLNDI